jgi:hypothetical protein
LETAAAISGGPPTPMAASDQPALGQVSVFLGVPCLLVLGVFSLLAYLIQFLTCNAPHLYCAEEKKVPPTVEVSTDIVPPDDKPFDVVLYGG